MIAGHCGLQWSPKREPKEQVSAPLEACAGCFPPSWARRAPTRFCGSLIRSAMSEVESVSPGLSREVCETSFEDILRVIGWNENKVATP